MLILFNIYFLTNIDTRKGLRNNELQIISIFSILRQINGLLRFPVIRVNRRKSTENRSDSIDNLLRFVRFLMIRK